jgi:hypothetical protein
MVNQITAEQKNRFRQEKMAKTDLMWRDEDRMIKLSPSIDKCLKISFNFKICCLCETDKEVMAEIDSDSHVRW